MTVFDKFINHPLVLLLCGVVWLADASFMELDHGWIITKTLVAGIYLTCFIFNMIKRFSKHE